MLTAITYNCDPESLADVPADDFATAFENEVYAVPHYRELAVTVVFERGENGVVLFTSDDPDADISHEASYRDEFKRLAEKAFDHCCRN